MPRSAPRFLRLAAWSALALLALLCVALLGLWLWLPNSHELARRVSDEATQRLGVPVTVEDVQWSVLPTPRIVATGIRTGQEAPITIGRIEAFPRWAMLRERQLRVARVEIEDAVIHKESMQAFRGKSQGLRDTQGAVPVEEVRWRAVTYVSWSGVATVYEGEASFEPDWRPRTAELRRAGLAQPVSLALRRVGQEDRWKAEVQAGGGSALGELRLKEFDGGRLRIDGELAPRRVEIASAVAAFERRSPISGFASGRTTLQAEGDSPGELLRSLRTVSDLKVEQAVVLRFDIDRAVSTMGKERAGQTRLDSLTGRVETRNTDQGLWVRYSRLQATAGKYTAKGEAVVWKRQIDMEGTVDVVDGLVGLPFTLKGPTRQPDFSVPKSFWAGAAIGTAILPGIGTVLGARIGGALAGSGDAAAGARKTPAPPVRPGNR
jgi:hypothetical protein